LRTINTQISISGEKSRKLDTLAKLYFNTTIKQLKNVLKLKHHTGIQTEQMNYENSPGWI